MTVFSLFLKGLPLLYGLCGIVTFLGFFPSILDLWRGKPSANAATYWTWTATTFVTSLYAIFILHDLMFILVINLQLVACLTVLGLRLRLTMRSR